MGMHIFAVNKITCAMRTRSTSTTAQSTAEGKVIVYTRVSTDKQETAQQLRTIEEYLQRNHMTADAIIEEEGVSGGVSYADRQLGRDVLPSLRRGDTLIVAELSRLGRSMNDLHNFISKELKPRGVRLIVIASGIDLHCEHMRAVDEMLLQMIGFAAQLEKEMIQERTSSALQVRKDAIERDGYFTAKKSGRVVTKLGNPKFEDARAKAAAMKKAAAAESNAPILRVLKSVHRGKGNPTTAEYRKAVAIFVEKGIKTSTGLTINVARARAIWHRAHQSA